MRRSIFWLTAFTLFYLAAAAVFAFTTGNREFLYYLAIMVVLVVFVLTVHLQLNLSVAMLWALSVWGFLHMAGGILEGPPGWAYNGESHVLYNLWIIPDRLKYDNVLHGYGFGLVTLICWKGLRVATRRPDLYPTVGLLILCMAGGMGFGALNEVVEFGATQLVPETNVGGYENTGWDLVSNLVGCLVAAIVVRLRGPNYTSL